MTDPMPPPATGRLTLRADTAADLMTPNPVSVRRDATVRDVVAVLTDRGFTGAPVIDDAGRPVGVVTRTDILVHGREGAGHVPALTGDAAGPDEPPCGARRLPGGFHTGRADPTPVADIMTPGVFAVTTDTPVRRVTAEMAALKVHRVFVVDGDGVLVGVIGLFDLLRHLRP